MQYTISNIPERIDLALRAEAKQDGVCLNQAVIDALSRGLGMEPVKRHHDLDFLIDSWVADPAFDETIKDMRKIDEDMWR